MNKTIEVINNRVSLRQYAQVELSEEHKSLIIQSAMRAPTARNLMLYSIIEVENPELKKKLGKTCNHPWISKAPYILLFVADMQRWYDFYSLNGVSELCASKEEEFVTPDFSNLMMSCCDALIAAQNTVIAAESEGIGSCYVGDIMGQHETHREMFQLPKWVFPITLVCYGYYPDNENRAATDRFESRFLTFKNKYRHLGADEFDEMLVRMKNWFEDMKIKHNTNPGQTLYNSFTAGKPELEERRSVRAVVENWLTK